MTGHVPQEEVLHEHVSGNVQYKLVRDECYTFMPDDGSPPINIYSGRLTRWLHENNLKGLQRIKFPDESLEQIIARCGVDVQRAVSLTPEQAQQPVVVGMWPDGTGVLFDGAHRRYYWALRGKTELIGWTVPYDEWQAFVFTGGLVHDRVQIPLDKHVKCA